MGAEVPDPLRPVSDAKIGIILLTSKSFSNYFIIAHQKAPLP